MAGESEGMMTIYETQTKYVLIGGGDWVYFLGIEKLKLSIFLFTFVTGGRMELDHGWDITLRKRKIYLDLAGSRP